MGAALKFMIDGDARGLEFAMRKVDAAMAKSAQNAFVWQNTVDKKSKLDPEKSRQWDIEQASRNNRARALARQRLEARAAKAEALEKAEETRKGLLIEQNIKDQQAVKEAQQEQARRDIRARALRRQRAEERAERQKEMFKEIAEGYVPESFRRQREVNKKYPSYLAHQGAMFGASSAMFVSVARDTMASLASGANPITVFMQQAPQVMQAMTMINKSAFEVVKTLLKLPIGPWATFAGILSGIAVGGAIAYSHVERLVEKLSGIKFPDATVDYIPKHLKAVNRTAEAWKEVAKAVQAARDEYASMAEVGRRATEENRDEFNQKRRLLELEKQTALARAQSPGARNAVEREFGLKELALSEAERTAQRATQEILLTALSKEGEQKLLLGAQMKQGVPGKTKERADVELAKGRLEAAEEAWKLIEAARNNPGFLGRVSSRDIEKLYTQAVDKGPVQKFLRLASGGDKVSWQDIVDAEEGVRKERDELRNVYRAAVDSEHAHDVIRGKADDLTKKGSESMAEAAKVELELARQKKRDAAAGTRERQIFDAQQRLNDARAGGSGPAAQLTERERIGLGAASSITYSLLDESRKTSRNTAKLVEIALRRDTGATDGSF